MYKMSDLLPVLCKILFRIILKILLKSILKIFKILDRISKILFEDRLLFKRCIYIIYQLYNSH